MPTRFHAIGGPFRWILQRTVEVLARARVPASFLTFTSFTLCIIAGILFGTGRFFSAGIVLIPAAACDLLARPLAHRQPRTDFFGAFLKSVLHRYADLAVFVGILVYYSTVNRFLFALLTGVVIAGAVMVSYSQARAESLIDRCRVGFWERPQRLVLLILGSLLSAFPVALPAALLILAVGSNITVVHRIQRTWRETEGRRRATVLEQSAPVSQPALPFADSPVPARSEFHADTPAPAGEKESHLRELLARAAKRGA